MGIFKTRRETGQPVDAGGLHITPVSKSRHLRLPFLNNRVLIVSRPASVLVSGPSGKEERVMIPDATRRAQFAVSAAPAALAMILMTGRKAISRRYSHE